MLGNAVDVKAEAQLPDDRPAADGPDGGGAAMRPDARRQPAVGQLERPVQLLLGSASTRSATTWRTTTATAIRTASKKQKVYRWYAEQFAYLLGKLTAIPEGNGTMLDNTVVLWVSEFGDSNGHASNNLMWLLMGNAGGALKQGRVIDCAGRGTNDLLTALCQHLRRGRHLRQSCLRQRTAHRDLRLSGRRT